jgi:hypothetical protein
MSIKYNANVEVLAPVSLMIDRSTDPIPMQQFHKVGYQVVWANLFAATTAVQASGVLTAGAGEVTITAVTAGAAGNSILVAMTGDGTAGAETVLVVGNAIGIAIQSGVTTAAQLVTALEASPEAMALITVAVGTAGVMVAPDSVTLSGGSNGVIDGDVAFSVSNDGTNWDEITTIAFNIATVSGNACVAVEDVFFTYMKVDVGHGTLTSGTVKILATFKE